jgi:hypothetical protein
MSRSSGGACSVECRTVRSALSGEHKSPGAGVLLVGREVCWGSGRLVAGNHRIQYWVATVGQDGVGG